MHFYFSDLNDSLFFIASRDLGKDFQTLKELEEKNLREEFKENTDLQNGFLIAEFFATVFPCI